MLSTWAVFHRAFLHVPDSSRQSGHVFLPGSDLDFFPCLSFSQAVILPLLYCTEHTFLPSSPLQPSLICPSPTLVLAPLPPQERRSPSVCALAAWLRNGHGGPPWWT